MYKIMLADDEGIVIDSLKFIIEKEFGDECQIEYAKTGRSVIELAENYRPDIAIMDIQMPGINGIDAMKEIRANNKNVIFIVMSAYDKFDYAKEAIKLGVMEYITKPMEKSKIIAALQKAMGKIDKERMKRSNDLLIREKLETVVPIIESGLIYNMLFQEHFTEDIDNYKNLLGITQNQAYMLAVVCGDDQEGSHMTNAVGSSVKMQQHDKVVRECMKEYYPNCVVGSTMGNKLAVMIPYDGDKMEYNERIAIIEKSRELVRVLRRKTDISFRVGISSVKTLEEARDSYKEALNALTMTTGSVAHVDDLPIGCQYEADYPIHLEKRLFAEVKNGETDHAIATAETYFDLVAANYADDLMNMRLKVLEFALFAEHLAYESGGMTYEFRAREDYLPAIMAISDLDTLKKWFGDKIGTATHNVSCKATEKSMSVVETAKEYIQNNYSKDISLDDVSRTVNISPYYFSKIFKEETGEGFVEYLTGIRIEKAKELLNTTEYSIKEICSMVGYADPNYFSRSFKKNVGVTPTEYKDGKPSAERVEDI
ncbi:MAG: response regulator [Lachnospiraceae bacterium]|nr:response regulator [Lachnospiraceae bacterium]MDD6628642.1 response regulator [Lachnospiraceae bacterium]